MNGRRVLSLLCAVAVVSGAVQLGAAPPARAAVTFASTAVAQNSQRCMDVPNSQTGDNVQLDQSTCGGGANQQFTFTPVAGTSDTYTVGSFAAGKCVDVFGVSTADNARIIQWGCNGGANQRFRLQPVTVAGSDKTFNLVATHSSKCIAVAGAATASGALLVQLPCSTATDRVWRLPGFSSDGGGGGGFQPLPNLPRNSCNDSSLPMSHGTNFPTPTDPFGFGWRNQSAIGWDGNWYPAFAYLSGSYFARGVPVRFTQGSTTFCGAMYSFSAYTFGLGSGQSPPAQSVQWTMDSGYLPALRTSFTRNNVTIAIRNFADRVVLGGTPSCWSTRASR